MEKYSETLSHKLNNLVTKIYDCEKEFKKASEHTDHAYLKKYFEKKSKEQSDFADELYGEIRSFCIESDNNPSPKEVENRTWMEIKTLFTFDDDQSMLEESITGEKAALEEFNDLLKESTLHLSTRALLYKHKEAIENDLKTIKKLDDLKN